MSSESLVNNPSESYLYAKEPYVLEKAKRIQVQEGRSWSYQDFPEIEYRYFKNIIWSLKKQGRIVIHIKSRPAFYRVIGVHIPGNHDLVNIDRMGDRVSQLVQMFKIIDIKQTGIHDIRLLGFALGLHDACSNKRFPTNHISKDITLIDWKLDAWRSVKVVVHNNDKFSVMFACANKPIIANQLHVFEWFTTLGRLQQQMSSLSGLEIPDVSLWQFRSAHDNTDYRIGIDAPEGLTFNTRDLAGALITIYVKKLPDEPKPVLRFETKERAEDKALFQKATELLRDTS